MKTDEAWMAIALSEAEAAAKEGEVPIGCVLVNDDREIARGHNLRETKRDALSHAEIEVIRKASEVQRAWRLGGTLYVTLEPCPMCVGAILQARIERVVFGCKDPKAGALGSLVNLLDYPFNHSFAVENGIGETQSRRLLQDFFKERR